MIDTHTHLYLEDFENGGADAVTRAIESGVRHLVFPNIDLDSVKPILELHSRFPDSTSVTTGLHPTSVDDSWCAHLRSIEREMKDVPIVAIGEVGVDLHWEQKWLKEQLEAFEWQLAMAREREIPVIIHARDAWEPTIQIIERLGSNRPKLLFHSFTDDYCIAQDLINRFDPIFGINGVSTFKNARALREAILKIGLNRIVLETDSPYLAPVPFRGHRNESSFIGNISERLVELFKCGKEEFDRKTDETACQLFNLMI